MLTHITHTNAGGEYYNYSGCGNTLNCNHPVVRDFIVDCLKYWVTVSRCFYARVCVIPHARACACVYCNAKLIADCIKYWLYTCMGSVHALLLTC